MSGSLWLHRRFVIDGLTGERHTPKMQRWGLLLQEYMPGMSISFKRSEENGALWIDRRGGVKGQPHDFFVNSKPDDTLRSAFPRSQSCPVVLTVKTAKLVLR